MEKSVKLSFKYDYLRLQHVIQPVLSVLLQCVPSVRTRLLVSPQPLIRQSVKVSKDCGSNPLATEPSSLPKYVSLVWLLVL